MIPIDSFRGFADRQPQPDTLGHMADLIRTDDALRTATLSHRQARESNDTTLARYHKSRVLCFAVAVRFSGGKADGHITGYTGLTLVDLDGIAPEQMAATVATVKADAHTLLAYTTLSGRGLRIIARYGEEAPLPSPPKGGGPDIAELNSSPWEGVGEAFAMPATPPPSGGGREGALPSAAMSATPPPSGGGWEGATPPSPYKRAFNAVNEYYRRLTGVEPDLKCSNPTRLSALAHDPDAYYNPDAQPFDTAALAAQYEAERRPVGRPKKVKSEEGRGKSEKMRVEACAAATLRELEHRGVRYEPGNHNKYISEACYLMNRFGVSLEDCTEWALKAFPDYAQTDDVPAIVRSCYTHTDEHATRQPHTPKKKGESAAASTNDIRQWFDEQGISTRYNVITRKYEVANGPDAPYTELTDRIVNTYYCDIVSTLCRRVFKGDLYAVIESDRSPEHNPMDEYLNSLAPWDGTTDPIGELAAMVTVSDGAADLHARFFKKWLVGMVATWLDPKNTNQVILTYIGRQGLYKSTFMRRLLPPQLTDYFAVRNFTQLMNTDDRLLLTEKALIGLEEIDTLTPAQVSQLNALVTTVTISERAAYARHRENRPHIASFCATGNNPHFITDVYGTRRWAPFYVTDIRSPYDTPVPYDEVYAQAYTLYRQGFAYWFTGDEIKELERHNQHFEEVSHEEELILTYLRRPYGDDAGEFVTSTRIIEIVGQYIRTRLNSRKVKRAMERLGFEQRKIHGQRGWNVVFLTGDDIKNNQRTNARESTPEE